MRNLRIIEALQIRGATLETLAENLGYLPQQIRRGLTQLEQQGIVAEDQNHYQLLDDSTDPLTRMIQPWIQTARESFYDIAQDAARLLLTKSWHEARVEDVLLFGSTLTKKQPGDIDLVILHSGYRFKEFDRYDIIEEEKRPSYDKPASDPDNARRDAYTHLRCAGYLDELADSVARHVGDRIAHMELGTESPETVQAVEGSLPDHAHAIIDVYGIENLFDIHVLHTKLLTDRVGQFATKRDEAITQSDDPGYLHRVLSTGKLFDRKTDDFTLTIEDRYPGALELFPVMERPA
jgi:predicted nucleotidyltransferase